MRNKPDQVLAASDIDLIHVKHLTIDKVDNYLDKNLKKKKETNRTLDLPFLLRQGEPGTSQYICQLGP